MLNYKTNSKNLKIIHLSVLSIISLVIVTIFLLYLLPIYTYTDYIYSPGVIKPDIIVYQTFYLNFGITKNLIDVVLSFAFLCAEIVLLVLAFALYKTKRKYSNIFSILAAVMFIVIIIMIPISFFVDKLPTN